MQSIGIVAPSPTPFTVGGAEKLWWGLLAYINAATPHVADLIKLPSPEHDLRAIVGSYAAFSRLDLSGFDVVITSKYPAWMAKHRHHVCYLQHRLRGLYDTYNAAAFGTEVPDAIPGIGALRRFMRENVGNRAQLPRFFEMFDDLSSATDTPPQALAFPGPLAREIVHFLDGCALQVGQIAHFAAISQTVARRPGYFPGGVTPTVVHHPSNLSGFRCGEFDYLFTASRLDGPKRVALLVQAMRHVRSDIRLRIAGTGPDGDALREMARGDDRIEFLGFVRDEELVGLYADALAVPYVPLEEDYGLITLEAMSCGKPVITCTDSGGTLELVADGRTGWVVAPEPKAIAERIDQVARDRDRARTMGDDARKSVAGISWQATVDRLLGACLPKPRRAGGRPRRRITVANSYPVFPPRGGGQARIFNLYGHLARYHDIDIIVFAEHGGQGGVQEIAPGLKEVRVPFSPKHVEAEVRLREENGFLQIADVAMIDLAPLTPDFGAALRSHADRSDLVIASHPYLYPALVEAAPGKPLGHESQNAEYPMKRQMIPDNPASQRLLQRLHDVEQACCRSARFILACSPEDRATLSALYGVENDHFILVPNGVDLSDVPFMPSESRRALREHLGVADQRIVLFMGSWHEPNVRARDRLLKLAHAFPAVAFLLMGSVCLAPFDETPPSNVSLLGVVDDEERKVLLQAADWAINPMLSGSGTNVKMLDYLAAGLPVVTTKYGARGLQLEPGIQAIVCEDGDLEESLAGALAMDERSRVAMAIAGRRHVERHFDWAAIADAVDEAWRDMGIA